MKPTLEFSILENGKAAIAAGVVNNLVPAYDHDGDSGMRLYVLEDTLLQPFVPTLIPHGIAVKPPEGHETQIRPRSSTLFKRNIHVAMGTIDYPYRGELMSCVMYTPRFASGEPLKLKAGDRVSQLVCQPVTLVKTICKESLEETSRGDGGFGSTGT